MGPWGTQPSCCGTLPWRGFVLALAWAVLFSIAAAPAWADELKLENGDVLHGKVTGADDKNVTIKHAFGDEVVVPIEKVFSIETDEPAVVRLKDGSQIKGKLKTGPEKRSVSIETADAGRIEKVGLDKVEGIGALPPAAWAGRIALGITILDGNTQGKSFFASFDGERRSKTDLIEAHAYYGYGETFGELTTRKSYARLQYSYFVLDPLYLYVGAAFEYDRFRNLNLRSRGGGGLGYAWINTPELAFRTEAGIEYVNEDLRGSEDRRFAALRGALTFDWAITDWLRFREFFEIFPSVEKWKQFVTHSETSLSAAIWKGFGVAFVIVWDHVQVPAAGRERNDEQYILTFTYAF